MLAQNFKTPNALGIEDAGFEALVKVLGMLEREEIPAENFRMEFWNEKFSCGTVHCIGGWAQAVAATKEIFNTCTAGLGDLFYPRPGCESAWRASRAQAAVALRNYLTSGEPRWHEAMAA